MKKTYSPPELEIIRLQTQDIITTSADSAENDNEVRASSIFDMK
mgnify:CR=1 FL=1